MDEEVEGEPAGTPAGAPAGTPSAHAVCFFFPPRLRRCAGGRVARADVIHGEDLHPSDGASA